MPDFETRRRMMVDTQVRPSDVTKFPIIDAMLIVPREKFVPGAMTEAAYVGGNVAIDEGRVLLDPRTLAKMIGELDLSGDELALDVGVGYGYSAAVLARMVQVVVAVEEDETLAAEAQGVLTDIGADNVIVHEGPLADGASEHGPYDVVIVQGGIEILPDGLVAQVKEGGQIVCIFMSGEMGEVRLGHKEGARIVWRFAFNATAPVLPGFAREPAFTL